MCTSSTRSSTLALCVLTLNVISCRKHDEAPNPETEASPREFPELHEADDAVTDDVIDDPIPQDDNHGRMRFQFGLGSDADARTCDLWWDTTWRSSQGDCPDCTWTADVEFAMDEEASLGADTCVSGDFTDFKLSLGYESLGYQEQGLELGELWYYAEGYGEWYPFWTATWEPESGALELYGGLYEYSLPYTSAPYYYTSWWTGYATVQW